MELIHQTYQKLKSGQVSNFKNGTLLPSDKFTTLFFSFLTCVLGSATESGLEVQ